MHSNKEENSSWWTDLTHKLKQQFKHNGEGLNKPPKSDWQSIPHKNLKQDKKKKTQNKMCKKQIYENRHSFNMLDFLFPVFASECSHARQVDF